MKLSFYSSIFFLISYLTLDVVILNEFSGDRPLVQYSAGLALISMVVYVSTYFSRLKKVFYQWSFLLYWGIFVLFIIGYYLLSFIDLPTEYAQNSLRYVAIAVFIYSVVIFTYMSTIKGHLKGKILFMLVGALFINGLFEIFIELTMNTQIRGGIEEINTSAGYIFVMILPVLMYLYRQNYLWVFGITLVLTMISGKRGALLIYVVLALYMILKYRILKKEGTINWKTFLAIACMVGGGYFFYESAFESFQYRILDSIVEYEQNRIGSGRNIILGNLLEHWIDTHVAFQLIGSGLFATVGINKLTAHNDYVEYLIDFGLIGLASWIFIQFRFYKNIRKIRYKNHYLYILLVMCLLILIGRGLFAGTLRSDQIYLSISFGYLLGISTESNG